MDIIQSLARALDRQIPPGTWHDQIFAYCERGSDAAFWAEPLNALTNAAFLLAALAALTLWATRPPENRRAIDLALVALVAVIGVGSFLFHTLANRWAAVADTAPIGLFMLAYLIYALRRFLAAPWYIVALGLGVFLAAGQQAATLRSAAGTLALGGSVAYLPAFAALLIIGLGLAVRRHPAAAYILPGAAVFAASLAFRTLDRQMCPQTFLPTVGTIGTHFLWHVLNGLLLYLLLRAAVLHGGPTRQGASS
ncbi:MAG: ceramidase domain-containing protein [Hyphomicrobiaceae bacterium]|nr:ceramidase domain-containing protein [Hyphomicrobiaceae bacterium]